MRYLQHIAGTLFSRTRRGPCWALALACVSLLFLDVSAHSAETRELYRVRVMNRDGGPVEVSADGGQSYSRVGKVTRPATTSVRGYLASVYASPGTVAATAVHGIRIKTDGARGCGREEARIISIVPREFAVAPKGFGGHVPGSSGICTDIPAGEAIFRNLAPFVGNPVFRQIGERLAPLAEGYAPRDGDILVIIVRIPVRYPREIILENRAGGRVEVVYADGRETIARVQRPVRGVGRFDATGYTGVGRINTNHTGVLTISTAPVGRGEKDGSPVETRGGFMLQPSRHARTSSETAQILVVAPVSEGDPWLEGAPPLFAGYIGLAHDPINEQNSFCVDVKTSGTDWRPLPPLVGRQDDALANMPDGAGAVTHIRIRFPELSTEWVRAELGRCSRSYLEACRAAGIRNGTVVRTPLLNIALDAPGLKNVQFARLYLDGTVTCISNSPPYTFLLDTRRLSEGQHVAELQAVDAHGRTLKRLKRAFFVQGQKLPGDADSEER